MILTDRLGPDILSAFWTKGQVLHRERAHLKVPGSSIVLNVLLARKLPTFLSRLNEISGGCEKIALVSGSFLQYWGLGPSYANLFVGYVEHQFFNQYDGPKPDFYGRYIDNCIGAISSSREELNRFITSVNSFHPALKYTWEISETSLAFLDIKVSINGNGLHTSVHYKPTDSHSYLLHLSSHPSHVKNAIPYSQFLRLRRLCSDDSDFSNKSQAMCQFFEKRGYPASVIQTALYRAQQTDRQSALQSSQKEKNDRIPFTLTFHPHNNPVKAIILNNFKILQNDPETSAIFSQPPLISFKRDKNVGNFLVKSTSKQLRNLVLSNARARDAKLVLSSKTLEICSL